MSEMLRILYVGDLRYGGTCLQRMNALGDLGHKIVALNTHPKAVVATMGTFTYRLWHRFFGPIDLAKINRAILAKLEKNK